MSHERISNEIIHIKQHLKYSPTSLITKLQEEVDGVSSQTCHNYQKDASEEMNEGQILVQLHIFYIYC